MSGLLDWLSSQVPGVQKAGEFTLFLVSISLFLDFFKVFDLTKFGVPHLQFVLWIYLLVNVSVVNLFKIFGKSNKQQVSKHNKSKKENKNAKNND